MQISIIGAITQDIVAFIDRPGYLALGGTLYNAIALHALSEHRISLVANIGHDIATELARYLDAFPRIDRSLIATRAEHNVRCYLLELPEATVEMHRHLPPRISSSQLQQVLSHDALLVTFPIGYELSLPTLKQLRADYNGVIYLDYHTLSLAADKHGIRYWRKRNQWQEWVRDVEIVQFNHHEAAALAGSALHTPVEIRDFCGAILRQKVNVVLLTLGPEGCIAAWQDRRGVQVERYAGVPAPDLRSTIGCGDVFASGFLAAYCQAGNIAESAHAALHAAALKCSVSQVLDLPQALSPLREQSLRSAN